MGGSLYIQCGVDLKWVRPLCACIFHLQPNLAAIGSTVPRGDGCVNWMRWWLPGWNQYRWNQHEIQLRLRSNHWLRFQRSWPRFKFSNHEVLSPCLARVLGLHWVDWRGPSSRCIEKKRCVVRDAFEALRPPETTSHIWSMWDEWIIFFSNCPPALAGSGATLRCTEQSWPSSPSKRRMVSCLWVIWHSSWITWIIFGERPKTKTVPWSSMNDSWWINDE